MVSNDLKKVILGTMLWIIALNSINLLSRYLLFDRTSYETVYGLKTSFYPLLAPWLNFDGQNYLKIIISGYDVQSLVFFPFFPVLVMTFSNVFLLNPIVVGFTVTNIAAVACAVLLFKIVRDNYSKKIAYKSILLLLVFPSSFFLIAYYTESIFLLLSLLTFFFLDRKKYFFASVSVFIACSTRIFGLALLPPLFLEAYKFYVDTKKFPVSVLLGPFGLISYLIYSQNKFLDPFLVVKGQQAERFARDIGILSPFRVLFSSFSNVLAGPKPAYDSPFVYPVIVMEFLVIIFALIMLVFTFGKLAFKYWIYCASFVLIVAYSGGLSSDLRYLMVLFPFYIFLANKMNGVLFKLWIFSSAAFLVMLSSLFLRNYWVA